MSNGDIDFSKFTEEQLHSECRKRNLPTGGSKGEIIKRLAVSIAMAKVQGDNARSEEKEAKSVPMEESDSDDEIGPMRMMNKKEEKKEEKPAEETTKQQDADESDSDSDIGPMRMMKKEEETKEKEESEEQQELEESESAPKEFFLYDLPSASMYEKSYTHPSHILLSTVTPITNYLYTASIDGSVKIWKKFPTGIEFVKHYLSHKGRVTSLVSSFDGLYVASAGDDNSIKIYDVVSFDLIRIMSLDFPPGPVCWVHNNNMKAPLLAVANQTTHDISVYDIEEMEVKFAFKAHKTAVIGIAYNSAQDYVVSLDKGGSFNYWVPRDGSIPKDKIQFKFQVTTDLFHFRKNNVTPLSLSMSASGKFMGIFGNDWKMCVFDVTTGKLRFSIDESEEVYKELFSKDLLPVDSFHFNQKLKTESVIREKANDEGLDSPINCVFDKGDNCVLYGTLFGVKVVSLSTGEACITMGEVENTERFMHVSLFQGISKVSSQMKIGLRKAKQKELEMSRAKQDVPDIQNKRFDGSKEDESDPTVFATAFEKRRFYLFTRREPDLSASEPRDVINEKEVAEEDLLKEENAAPAKFMAKRVVLHTTSGDIELELWENIAPKAVENFSTLAKQGYYDGVLFHRVIKGFMIQTGDPTGTGYGGNSIWDKEFENECVKGVTFDDSFLLAMANAGLNTNRSQFFITTAPAHHLDGKHTIFGKVIKGQSVVKAIERVRVQNDKYRPFEDIKIVSTDVYTS